MPGRHRSTVRFGSVGADCRGQIGPCFWEKIRLRSVSAFACFASGVCAPVPSGLDTSVSTPSAPSTTPTHTLTTRSRRHVTALSGSATLLLTYGPPLPVPVLMHAPIPAEPAWHARLSRSSKALTSAKVGDVVAGTGEFAVKAMPWSVEPAGEADRRKVRAGVSTGDHTACMRLRSVRLAGRRMGMPIRSLGYRCPVGADRLFGSDRQVPIAEGRSAHVSGKRSA